MSDLPIYEPLAPDEWRKEGTGGGPVEGIGEDSDDESISVKLVREREDLKRSGSDASPAKLC